MKDDSESKEMDSRCPRMLTEHPEQYCPLAVMRLRAIRTANKELTEEEESKLPGCPWAVAHQLANYCFFKYIQEYSSDKPLSDMEIASLNGISIDAVKKTEKSALNKIREAKEFNSLKSELDGENVVQETFLDEDYKIYR